MKKTPDEITPKARFISSLNRCMTNDQFMPTFYERFMASSDDIKHRFRFTSFERQYRLLLRSLELSAGAIDGEPEALAELKERAESHDRNHLNIKPELYQFWLDSLLKTAEEFDKKWDDSTASAWRMILGFVINRLIASY